MKRMAAIAGLAIGLAGCSGGDADAGDAATATATATAPAEAVAEAAVIKPEPGLYRATITMTGIDVPGMPAEMEGHGAGMTTTSEDCLTQEDVGRGMQELVKQGQNGQCTYEEFAFDGGKFDAVLLCKTPQGAARIEMAGTATATGTDLTATTKLNFEGMGEATMSFTAKHERIGDCPAK